MIVYEGQPKKSTKATRTIILSEINKVTGETINKQRSIAFVYTTIHETLKINIKSIIHFTMATKNMKYLRIIFKICGNLLKP